MLRLVCYYAFQVVDVLYARLVAAGGTCLTSALDNCRHDLSGDYFQTTIMLFDTAIINSTTLARLLALRRDFCLALIFPV